MTGIATTVRLPPHLKSDIEQLVHEGYYKNTSDFLLASAREKAEKERLPKATLMLREYRRKETEKYLKKAKGSQKKAWELFFNDVLKEEKEFDKFIKSVKAPRAQK